MRIFLDFIVLFVSIILFLILDEAKMYFLRKQTDCDVRNKLQFMRSLCYDFMIGLELIFHELPLVIVSLGNFKIQIKASEVKLSYTK